MAATVVCAILAIFCGIISILQFLQKGPVFNNAYLYASKHQREQMDRTPHYRQSGIVFALLAAIFLCIAVQAATKTGWPMIAAALLMAATVVYAVVSSVRISAKQ